MTAPRLWIGAAVLALSACARPAPAELTGQYRPDCAPYDGPAFTIVLSDAGGAREIWLRANAPLSAAVGAWRHGRESRPGTASIALCEAGEGGGCTAPLSGAFRVEAIVRGRMNGAVQATFADGEHIAAAFSAAAMALPEGPPRCR